MASSTRRESIEVLGLVAEKRSTELTPQGRARDAAGLPVCGDDYAPTSTLFELEDGRTVVEVRDAMLAASKVYAPSDPFCQLLRRFAAEVDQIGETVGELLARTGLDENATVTIRFPTVAEDRAKLAQVLAAAKGRVA